MILYVWDEAKVLHFCQVMPALPSRDHTLGIKDVSDFTIPWSSFYWLSDKWSYTTWPPYLIWQPTPQWASSSATFNACSFSYTTILKCFFFCQSFLSHEICQPCPLPFRNHCLSLSGNHCASEGFLSAFLPCPSLHCITPVLLGETYGKKLVGDP